MATPQVGPPRAAGPNFDAALQQPMQPPGNDMMEICFRDQLWLSTHPLDRNFIFDYFALLPFSDWRRNNEDLRMRSIHPLGCALYYILKGFATAPSKLEKIGYVGAENGSEPFESKTTKETIDFEEVKRVDQILASLQRKSPPAPPPPPFPDGILPPPTSGAEKDSENQQAGEAQPHPVDPIINQGPSKRMKF